jgi:hypothetical protein
MWRVRGREGTDVESAVRDVEGERELTWRVRGREGTDVESERELDHVVHFSCPPFRSLNEPFLRPAMHPAMDHHTPTPMRNNTPTPISGNDNSQAGEGRGKWQ